jgi:hypothetical protein
MKKIALVVMFIVAFALPMVCWSAPGNSGNGGNNGNGGGIDSPGQGGGNGLL